MSFQIYKLKDLHKTNFERKERNSETWNMERNKESYNVWENWPPSSVHRGQYRRSLSETPETLIVSFGWQLDIEWIESSEQSIGTDLKFHLYAHNGISGYILDAGVRLLMYRLCWSISLVLPGFQSPLENRTIPIFLLYFTIIARFNIYAKYFINADNGIVIRNN